MQQELADLRHTGWATSRGGTILWHFFVAGRSVCQRRIGWPVEAIEPGTEETPSLCCPECRGRFERALPGITESGTRHVITGVRVNGRGVQ